MGSFYFYTMSNPFEELHSNISIHFQEKVKHERLYSRKQKLIRIKQWIKKNQTEIQNAIYSDFRKSPEEVLFSDIKPVLEEIKDALKHLRDWADDEKVTTPIYLLGSRSRVIKEPKGVCLIIAPWNFPFMLTIGPLISAIAAGNCAVLKPSEMTPNTEKLISRMIGELFPPKEISVVTGGVEETQQLLSLKWDHIFFTGSPQVGKIIMKAAAEHLTSVTLELGGKNPVIVDDTAKIKDTAEKLVWGKFFNCGQSCISPNYVLVNSKVEEQLKSALKTAVQKLYLQKGELKENGDFARVVNSHHYDRINSLIQKSLQGGSKVLFGNETDEEENYISPTILESVTTSSPIFQEEIFGPVLPLITYTNLDEAISIINKEEKPLALYIFSKSRKNINKVLKSTSAGTTGINETTIHFIHPNLPFGGVNQSGLGKAHGKYGFDAFSNQRAVLKQRTGFTTPKLIYPPFTSLKRRILKILTWWL